MKEDELKDKQFIKRIKENEVNSLEENQINKDINLNDNLNFLKVKNPIEDLEKENNIFDEVFSNNFKKNFFRDNNKFCKDENQDLSPDKEVKFRLLENEIVPSDNVKIETEAHKELLFSSKSLDSEAEKIPISLLEETLNRIGYGKYQILCIIISLFCFMAYGINLTIFASMVIPMQKYFKLTDIELSTISGLLHIGTALGHLVTGFITKTFTRKQTVLSLLAFIFVFSFLIGYIGNIYLFALFRVAIGFGIGMLMPLIINTLTEFLPSYYKSLSLMIALTGVYIGQLIPNFLMHELIPDLSETNIGLVQKICSSISLLSFICSIFLFDDSPISLVIKGENARALNLIQKMDSKNFYTREKKEMLFREMKSKFSIEGKEKSLRALFENKYKKSTILLTFIWFINSILFFGPAIIVSITMDKLEITMDKKSIIVNQINIILIGLLGFLLGGYLSEFKGLGRLKSIMIGFILLIIFVFLTILFPKYFSFFYGVAYSATPLFYFIIPIYTAEFYPSRLRDLGLGYLYFINKIGALISQFIFIHLSQAHTNLPFYGIIFLGALNVIFIKMMPYETLNKGMDFMEKIELNR